MAFRKTSYTNQEWFKGQHRFEHWYRDRTVYFITSKVRDAMHAFMNDQAKAIFWDRLTHWSAQFCFIPWIVTLMSNHYHILGYIEIGEDVGRFMQRFHGSVSKLVNDTLPQRHLPFWRHQGNQDYFDGCLRDVLQLTRAFNYTKLQAVRAHLVTDFRLYHDTRIFKPLPECVDFAVAHNAFWRTFRTRATIDIKREGERADNLRGR